MFAIVKQGYGIPIVCAPSDRKVETKRDQGWTIRFERADLDIRLGRSHVHTGLTSNEKKSGKIGQHVSHWIVPSGFPAPMVMTGRRKATPSSQFSMV
jgi:hypothetical protein